ncbi:MAG TPA: COX15/CtaA family protein [Gaiellaceae bacterium]|nr:COX15/CtaA family protein [Gaiellaceae bacterium]
MHVESVPQALPRRRALVLSPAGFRRLAMVTTGMLVLIVATGATVRLTGSGLGCEHWPGCQPGDPFPARGYHSDIEFSNRVVAFLTVLTTLALAIGALRTRGLGRGTKILAGLVFAGTLAQAPLGAVTVYYHLNPWLVISHLLLSLVVLSLGVLVLLSATLLLRGGDPPLPGIARTAGAVLLAAVAALVVSGTLATAAGKFPGNSGDTRVRRLGAFQPAVAVHVRVVAAFGIVFLFLAAWAWLQRSRYPWLLRGCAVLLGLLAVQMAVGELQYRTYGTVSWYVVLIHVALAAALFAWTVGLAARLWRPLAHPGAT